MKFKFEEIKVKRKTLINSGKFELPDSGLYVIKGKNGVGKSLFMNQLFHNKKREGTKCVFIDQSSNRILKNESIYYNIWGDGLKNYDDDKTNELLNHNSNELSGGEKRFICLLRGLLSEEAKIIFIDEPTNELDFIVINKIKEILSEIKKDKLIIVITHDSRISNIVDGEFLIKDGRLTSNCTNIKENNKFFQCEIEKSNEINKSILKQFQFDYFSYFIILIFILITLISGIKIIEAKTTSISEMPANEINIFVPVSEYYMQNKESCLQIKYTELLTDKKPINTVVKELYDNSFERGDVNFYLELNNTEKYKVYDMEYYDIANRQSFIIMDEYELLENKNMNYKKYKEYFTLKHPNDEDDIDIEGFQQIASYYNSNKTSIGDTYKVVCYTVLLEEGTTFYDFLKDEQFLRLLDGNYYIRSNEIITIINDSKIINALKESTILIMISSIALLLLQVIYYLLYLYSKRITIRIYRNMIIDENIIKNSIYKKIGNKMVIVIFFILLGMAGIYQMIIAKTGEIIILIWIMVSIGFLINYLIVSITKKWRVSKMLDWRYRC